MESLNKNRRELEIGFGVPENIRVLAQDKEFLRGLDAQGYSFMEDEGGPTLMTLDKNNIIKVLREAGILGDGLQLLDKRARVFWLDRYNNKLIEVRLADTGHE